jgi:hypothetical protein
MFSHNYFLISYYYQTANSQMSGLTKSKKRPQALFFHPPRFSLNSSNNKLTKLKLLATDESTYPHSRSISISKNYNNSSAKVSRKSSNTKTQGKLKFGVEGSLEGKTKQHGKEGKCTPETVDFKEQYGNRKTGIIGKCTQLKRKKVLEIANK